MIPIIIGRIITHVFDIFQERRLSVGKIDNNKQMKRESLLDSAFSLFIDNGFNKTSISDIVNNAGVAKGTFYLYFKDKYDIRNHLIAHKASQIFQAAYADLLRHPDIQDFEEQVLFITDNILDQFAANHSLVTLISKGVLQKFAYIFSVQGRTRYLHNLRIAALSRGIYVPLTGADVLYDSGTRKRHKLQCHPVSAANPA